MTAAHSPNIGFYASVQDGKRHGLLLGPFATHAEAEAHVTTAAHAAAKIDGFAGFYCFGTARVQTRGKLPVGRLNGMSGITPTIQS